MAITKEADGVFFLAVKVDCTTVESQTVVFDCFGQEVADPSMPFSGYYIVTEPPLPDDPANADAMPLLAK